MADKTPVVLENVKIIFRNFAGSAGDYNKEGDRNFGIRLEDRRIAEDLLAQGYNVKELKLRDDADEGALPDCWLPVKVKWPKPDQKVEPPQVYLIGGSSKRKTKVKEDEAELLDYAEILTVDLIIRPYDWEVNGNTGRTAYLKALYATVIEDPLALKYADPDPEAGAVPMTNDGDPLPF